MGREEGNNDTLSDSCLLLCGKGCLEKREGNNAIFLFLYCICNGIYST